VLILKNKNQQRIVDTLEIRGYYTLAADAREVFADKVSRRAADIEAIKYAGALRDKVEDLITGILENKIGMSPKDLKDLLEDDLDKLEEKFNKILSEHLEYKSNNPEQPAEENTGEEDEGDEETNIDVNVDVEKPEEITEAPEESEEITEAPEESEEITEAPEESEEEGEEGE
jgi:hypothetical protein